MRNVARWAVVITVALMLFGQSAPALAGDNKIPSWTPRYVRAAQLVPAEYIPLKTLPLEFPLPLYSSHSKSQSIVQKSSTGDVIASCTTSDSCETVFRFYRDYILKNNWLSQKKPDMLGTPDNPVISFSVRKNNRVATIQLRGAGQKSTMVFLCSRLKKTS